jgi:hypothetical protein
VEQLIAEFTVSPGADCRQPFQPDGKDQQRVDGNDE